MSDQRFGEYRVLGRLGRGGMGSVYLAEDPRGQRVAVKVLEGTLNLDPAALRRFEQELEVLRRLDHPRIVRALGAGIGSEDGAHWYAMEYVAGRNLSQFLAAHGRMPPALALDIVAEALEGLAAAHGRGVLHRDIKSSNLLLDREGHVKLCDFGIARAVDLTRLTLSGQFLGTPAYVAPEQADGQDHRPESDLYSLGVVLYETLTGALPFRAATPVALLRMHLDTPPEPPSARKPGLGDAVDGLVLRSLAKRPADRYPDAVSMREAVLEVRRGLPQTDPTERLDLLGVNAQDETTPLGTVPADKAEEPGSVPAGSPARPRRWRRWALVGLVLLVLSAVLFVSRVRDHAVPGPADFPRVRLVLKDGRIVEGGLAAMDARTVRIQQGDGTVVDFSQDECREVRHLGPESLGHDR